MVVDEVASEAHVVGESAEGDKRRWIKACFTILWLPQVFQIYMDFKRRELVIPLYLLVNTCIEISLGSSCV